jgi:hypothetical protein
MSYFITAARSNYFQVRNVAAFCAAIAGAGLDVEVLEHERLADYVRLKASFDDGGFPKGDEGDELVGLLQQHLAPGAVAVLMEVSTDDEERFVSGNAVAIAAEGRPVQMNLDDIYRRAARRFCVPVDAISRAEFDDVAEAPAPQQMR